MSSGSGESLGSVRGCPSGACPMQGAFYRRRYSGGRYWRASARWGSWMEVAAVQVSDGPGHPQDAVIAAGGEPHPVKGPLHQPLALRVQGAEPVQLLLAHPGVAGGVPIAPTLDVPGPVHPALDDGGGLRRGAAGQLTELQGGHLHKQVDAVQKGAGQAGEIAPAPPAPCSGSGRWGGRTSRTCRGSWRTPA